MQTSQYRMFGFSRIAVRTFVEAHHLHLRSLPARERRLVAAGLSTAGVLALAILFAWFTTPETGYVLNPQAAPMLFCASADLVLVTLAFGTSLLILTSATNHWRLQTLTRAALALVALLSVAAAASGLGSALIAQGARGQLALQWWSFALFWFLWLGGLSAVVVAITPGRVVAGRPSLFAGLAALPYAGVAAVVTAEAVAGAQVAEVAAILGWATMPPAVFGFLVPGGLLLWMGIEGARLSRDGAVWLIRSTTGLTRLLALALALKAIWLLYALSLRMNAWQQGPVGWALAGVAVLAAFWLLTSEQRLDLSEWDSKLASISLVGAVLLAVTAAIALNMVTFALQVAGNLSLDIGAIALVGVALLVRRMLCRGRWLRSAGASIAAATLLTLLPLINQLPAMNRLLLSFAPIPARLSQRLLALPGSAITGNVLLALVFAGVAVGVVILRRHRAVGVFAGALALWILPVLAGAVQADVAQSQSVLPPGIVLTGVRPGPFDAMLTLGIALLLLAWHRGWQRSVSPAELVLLMVVTTVVIYGEFVKLSLPQSWRTALVPVAMIAPVLMQFTLDVGPLNEPSEGRPGRVLGTVAAVVIALSMACAQILVLGPGQLQQVLIFQVAPIFLIPFAVVLVATTSKWLALEEGNAKCV